MNNGTDRNIYYYDTSRKDWFSVACHPCSTNSVLLDFSMYKLDDKTINELRSARRNNKFIIIQNGLYAGIPSRTLLIRIDENVRFVSKDCIYLSTGNQKTCINKGLVKNPRVLKTIKTQYPYVVEYIDSMQRERHPFRKEDEEANYTRAKKCFDGLTEDQQMYYIIEGDQKYLRL